MKTGCMAAILAGAILNATASETPLPAELLGPATKFIPLSPNTSEADFGKATATAGNLAVVGAPGQTVNGVTSAGVTYVYAHNGTSWTLDGKLTIEPAALGEQFGCATAIDDGAIIVGGKGTAKVYVFARTATNWMRIATLTGAAGSEFGSAIAAQTNRLVIGAPHEVQNGTPSGAVYVFQRIGNVWTQQARLVGETPTAGDLFGAAVAIDGDSIVIGSPGTSANGGATYVFVRNGNAWTQQSRLVAAGGAASDLFGSSVALEGDLLTVGAVGVDHAAATNSGAAYLFLRTGTTWAPGAKLLPQPLRPSSAFGSAIGIKSNQVIVGAPASAPLSFVNFFESKAVNAWRIRDPSSAAGSGTLSYSTNLTTDKRALASTNGWRLSMTSRMESGLGADQSVYFARGIATKRFLVWFDLNPQGQLIAIVPNSTIQPNIVLVTDPAAATNYYLHEIIGKPGDTEATYYFNGAPIVTWSGEPFDASAVIWGAGSTPGQGSMNYHRVDFEALDAARTPLASYNAGVGGGVAPNPTAQNWTFTDSSATPPISVSSDRILWIGTNLTHQTSNVNFGASIAVSDSRLIIGAPEDLTLNVRGGRALVFLRQASAWALEGSLPLVPLQFGGAIAFASNLVAVGAPADSASTAQPGAVYLYTKTGLNWTERTYVASPPSSAFGFAVAVGENVVFVGAPTANGASIGDGAVHVFGWDGTNTPLLATLSGAASALSDRFGHALSLSENRIAVGAPSDGPTDRGAAYVFVRSGDAWAQQVKIHGPAAATNRFGGSLSLDGNSLVVGASEEGSGAAYVYTWSGTQWSLQTRIPAPDSANDDEFGYSVSISGDVLALGSRGSGSPGVPGTGAGYLFVRSNTAWTLQSRIVPADLTVGKRFGNSISLSGGNVMVGAQLDDASGDNSGAAYLFVRNGTSWLERRKFILSNEQTNALFGASVFLAGETVLIGAPTYLEGAVYLWQTDYSNAQSVVQYGEKFLFYGGADAAPSSYFYREKAAYRFLDLLYAADETDAGRRVRAQVERMGNLFGPADIARASEASGVLKTALLQAPGNSELASSLLDIYYYRTVGETILAKAGQADADRLRLGPPSHPSGLVIDDEIAALEASLEQERSALKHYFELLGDTLGQAGETPFGYVIFQREAPGRAPRPAQYLATGGSLQPVTTDAAFATGYKDLLLLFDLLRHHGRSVAALGRLHLARRGPSDLESAGDLIDKTIKFLVLHGNVLLGVFPNLQPADVRGLTEAINGWERSIADLHLVQQAVGRADNLLGFDSDFLMLVQRFSGQPGEFFDSYDALNVRLSLNDASSPLAIAAARLAAARTSYASYRGFQDQLETELTEVNGAAEERLREIVGALPGEPAYVAPEANTGSELWQQRQSINSAQIAIQRNGVEIDNLAQEVQIELDRLNAVTNATIDFGNRRGLLTRKIGLIQAAQDALSIAGGIDSGVGAAVGGVAAATTLGIGIWKAFVEQDKEELAAEEQAIISGLESDAMIKTKLLGMNTLLLDSQSAALLMEQERGRLVRLYREKADLEQTIDESDDSVAGRYFADPTHRLRSQHDTLRANLAFAEAQKWLFFMARALEYKWNVPFANHTDLGRTWSTATLFTLRNAEELVDFYTAMHSFETKIQLIKDDYYDWFSVREDFFGYRYTNHLGQVLSYVDPSSGQTVNAIEMFRRHLRQIQDDLGNIQLTFSTVREIPGGSFFRGPRFGSSGQLLSKGLFLDKIRWLQISLPGQHTHGRSHLTGELSYGGTSFIRNFDVGSFDPTRPDRLRDELTSFSTRYWFFHPISGTWRANEALSSPVNMQLSANPRVPPTAQQIDVFKERSVATSGWKLLIPTRDQGQTVLDIDQLDDVEIYFYHYAVTRQ